MSILVLTSDTLIGTAATGNIEYNGQFFGTDSAASRAQLQRITQGTAVASTSGTSIDFTSIPSWVKRITVMFNGVSLSGTATLLFQIGAGSIANTGYAGNSSYSTGASGAGISSTSGFPINNTALAAETVSGTAIFSLLNSSTGFWVMQFVGNLGTAGYFVIGSGSKTLSGTLDRVRLTTSNGTDTFDAGSVNILYEG
jgi:hypothetical protein